MIAGGSIYNFACLTTFLIDHMMCSELVMVPIVTVWLYSVVLLIFRSGSFGKFKFFYLEHCQLDLLPQS